MARPFRYQYAGAIHHITVRGNERRAVFRDDTDRERFILKLREQLEQHHVRLYAYCLMPNHYHLVICTPRANLSAFMQQLNTSYTVWFNARHRRCGHLFGGRFKARLVEGGTYLLALTRYVHLNPVKVRPVRAQPEPERHRLLSDFPWSSFRGYAGYGQPESWVDYEPLSAFADQGTDRMRRGYREYVQSKVAQDDRQMREALELSSRSVGSEAFRRAAEGRMREARNLLPDRQRWVDISRRRVESGPSETAVTSAVLAEYATDPVALRRRGNREAKDAWIRLLLDECGLMAREVGRKIGHADGGTVGRRARAFASACRRDAAVRARYGRVLARITNAKA